MTPTLFASRNTLPPEGAVLAWGGPARRTLYAFGLLFVAATAQSQSVTLSGMVGNKALLIVDGNAPKIVAAGESFNGVKVVSTQGDTAVLMVGGKRLNMRVGDAPASVGEQAGSKSSGSRIVLSVGDGGHFLAQGSINGKSVQFMVDTGATAVAMGAAEAKRIGIDYTSGRPVRMNTANGQALGYLLTLNSVRIGDVEVQNVEAIVSPQHMPYVLLGNSFLTRFSMRRDNDQMVLERRF
jgi:aspartyl protease family protein